MPYRPDSPDQGPSSTASVLSLRHPWLITAAVAGDTDAARLATDLETYANATKRRGPPPGPITPWRSPGHCREVLSRIRLELLESGAAFNEQWVADFVNSARNQRRLGLAEALAGRTIRPEQVRRWAWYASRLPWRAFVAQLERDETA